jgi:hypothetical protein
VSLACPSPEVVAIVPRTMGVRTRPRSAYDGRIQPLTRGAVAGLLVLAILNAGFLYGVPGLGATDYAWPIEPSPAASFLGAGYLAGVVATALVVFAARRWRSIQPLAVALMTLSIGLIAATLLHAGTFSWDYPPTWAWTFVYATAPFGVLALSARQRSVTLRPMLADPRLDRLRALSLAAGAALGGYAVALFAFPTMLGDDWPWPLTPLLAQATASWLAMVAAALLWCAYDLRRAAEGFIAYITLGVWCLALLAIPALYAGDMRRTGAPLLLYLVALIALLGLAVLGATRTRAVPAAL